MKFPVRLTIGLGVFIILIIGIAVIKVLSLDPDGYKQIIVDQFKARTGRELIFAGGFTVSYYPWPGLGATDVWISNAPGSGDAPFIKIDKINIRAGWLPLLHGRLEMDTLVLHGATVNLVSNVAGIGNRDNFLPTNGKEGARNKWRVPLATLVSGGVNIKDVNIYWRDERRGLEYTFANINIRSGRLEPDKPVDVHATLDIAASTPALSSSVQFRGAVVYRDDGSISLDRITLLMDESQMRGNVNLTSLAPPELKFSLRIDNLNADRYVSSGSETDEVTPAALKYNGIYQGHIRLDADGEEPVLTLNATLSGVQIESLLTALDVKADVAGKANINLVLTSSGANSSLLKERLTGKVSVKLADGVLGGIDIPGVLRQVERMHKTGRIGKLDMDGETGFDSLTAELDINKGRIENRDLLITAPGFKINGEGVLIDLNDETWKYDFDIAADPESATLKNEHYDIGGHNIRVKCREKIADRKCRPGATSIFNIVLKQAIRQKTRKKIGNDATVGPADAESAETVGGETVKKVLDKLF